MANHYTKFSFALNVDPEEETLLREAEEEASSVQDPEFPAEAKVLYDEIEKKNRAVITHPDGAGGKERDAASLVQSFLEKADSDQTVVFSYAETCNKPRVGTFGGGCVVVTREGYNVTSTFQEKGRLERIAEQDSYRVETEIDVNAETPEEAASRAQELLQTPDTTATVFDVLSPLATEVDVAET